MPMIGHQAVGPDFHARFAATLVQKVEIELVIVVGTEHVQAPVATLGHRVRQSGDNEASDAGHWAMVIWGGETTGWRYLGIW